MRDGVIEQIGTPHEVFARPANAFVASFIGTPQMNLIAADLMRAEGADAPRSAWRAPTVACRSTRPSPRLPPGRISVGMRPRAVSLGAEQRRGASPPKPS